MTCSGCPHVRSSVRRHQAASWKRRRPLKRTWSPQAQCRHPALHQGEWPAVALVHLNSQPQCISSQGTEWAMKGHLWEILENGAKPGEMSPRESWFSKERANSEHCIPKRIHRAMSGDGNEFVCPLGCLVWRGRVWGWWGGGWCVS